MASCLALLGLLKTSLLLKFYEGLEGLEDSGISYLAFWTGPWSSLSVYAVGLDAYWPRSEADCQNP